MVGAVALLQRSRGLFEVEEVDGGEIAAVLNAGVFDGLDRLDLWRMDLVDMVVNEDGDPCTRCGVGERLGDVLCLEGVLERVKLNLGNHGYKACRVIRLELGVIDVETWRRYDTGTLEWARRHLELGHG